jgi:hypothetical protein
MIHRRKKIVRLGGDGREKGAYSAWKMAAGWLQEWPALVTKRPLSDGIYAKNAKARTSML